MYPVPPRIAPALYTNEAILCFRPDAILGLLILVYDTELNEELSWD